VPSAAEDQDVGRFLDLVSWSSMKRASARSGWNVLIPPLVS
jgi:hypothetical protein